MAVTTTAEFFDLLAKSEVLTPAKLAEARAEAEAAPDPKTAARELVRLNLLTKWQAGVLVGGRSTLRLGKYTLLEQLGSEEIGLVYLAEHVQMGRRVVIKTLSNKYTNNQEAVKRFLSEAQRIAALHHRNIIHLFDVSSEQDRYYIVLEHSEGKDFQALVSSGGALAREVAADYLIQAAEGLAHAHAKGLYHGDITPENLLVDAQGQVKILNFGVARLVENMAQVASAEADLAALGEVGTFLLTGKSGLGKRKSAPPGIESICLKMTTDNRAERFTSADEAAAALKKWLSEQKTAGPSFAPKIARAVSLAAAKSEPPKPKPPALARHSSAVTSVAAAAAVAEPAPERINIVVGGTPKKAPEKPQTAPAADVAAEDAEASSEADVEKKLPMGLLIGGGAGAGVLAMLLLTLGLWFFWPRGEKAVVQAPKPPEEEAPADPDEDLKNPEIKIADPQPDPAPSADPMPMPVDPPQPDPPMPDPPPAVPEDPAKPVPPPDPAPATPVEPQKNPFAELAAAVDLPKLGAPEMPDPDATNPVPLGSLYVQPKDVFLIELLGGDTAAPKGKQTFSIKAGKGGAADRDWEISMTGGESGGTNVVALLSAKDDKLVFQWTGQAVRDAGANHLRNCVLSSRTGAHTHALALRTPVVAQPVLVNFDKAQMRSDVDLDYLPDAGAIEIEITTLEGAPSAYRFDPKATFEAGGVGKSKDSTAILLGNDKEEALILKVESLVQKRLSVAVSPFFRLAVQPKESKYNVALWKQAVTYVATQNTIWFNNLDQANKIQNPNPTQQQFKSLADQNYKKCQDAIKQVEDTNAIHAAIHNTGKIHFRVYFKAGEQIVDLARSDAPPGGQVAP